MSDSWNWLRTSANVHIVYRPLLETWAVMFLMPITWPCIGQTFESQAYVDRMLGTSHVSPAPEPEAEAAAEVALPAAEAAAAEAPETTQNPLQPVLSENVTRQDLHSMAYNACTFRIESRKQVATGLHFASLGDTHRQQKQQLMRPLQQQRLQWHRHLHRNEAQTGSKWMRGNINASGECPVSFTRLPVVHFQQAVRIVNTLISAAHRVTRLHCSGRYMQTIATPQRMIPVQKQCCCSCRLRAGVSGIPEADAAVDAAPAPAAAAAAANHDDGQPIYTTAKTFSNKRSSWAVVVLAFAQSQSCPAASERSSVVSV